MTKIGSTDADPADGPALARPSPTPPSAALDEQTAPAPAVVYGGSQPKQWEAARVHLAALRDAGDMGALLAVCAQVAPDAGINPAGEHAAFRLYRACLAAVQTRPWPTFRVGPASDVTALLDAAGAEQYSQQCATVGRLATPEEVAAPEPGHPLPVGEFFEVIEARAGHPCYRSINVTLDDKGKKRPRGEKNDLSPEQIGANRGSGNTLSLSVKHVPDLYVVDFDTKELDGCALRDFLVERGVSWTETAKGFHYYVLLPEMVAYTQQQKVCADKRYEVDLLKTNNVWETKERRIAGALMEIAWGDIAPYFDVAKMTGSSGLGQAAFVQGPLTREPRHNTTAPVAAQTLPAPATDAAPFALDAMSGADRAEYEEITALLRLVPPDCEYDAWVMLGMCLHTECRGVSNSWHLQLWDTWSAGSEKYKRGECARKWATFRVGTAQQRGFGSLVRYVRETHPDEYAALACPPGAVSAALNSMFAAHGVDRELRWAVAGRDDVTVQLANSDGVCAARLGSHRECLEHTQGSSTLTIVRKKAGGIRQITATCTAGCKQCSLTKQPAFALSGALESALWPPRAESDITPDTELSKKQVQQSIINDAVLAYIAKHELSKDGGTVVQCDPRCLHNRVPVRVDHGNGRRVSMTIEMLVSRVENADETVGQLIKGDPSFRASTLRFLTGDINGFPQVMRSKVVYGYQNGLYEIGEYLPDGDDCDVQRGTPLCRFTPYGDIDDGHHLCNIIVRVYIHTDFQQSWLSMDERSLLCKYCSVLDSVLAPSFGESVVEEWSINGKTEEWPIGFLLLAMLARLLFDVRLMDSWRVALWLWGESSCGKTTLVALVRALQSQGCVGEIADTFEKVFGLYNIRDKDLAVLPDVKRPEGAPFALTEATYQIMVEGGQVPVPEKNAKGGGAAGVAWTVPMVACSQYPPTPDIWTDPRQAVSNRTFCFHFDTLPSTTNDELEAQMTAPTQLGPSLVLITRLYCRLKAFVGNKGFAEWAKTLDYISDQYDTQKLANNPLLRFLTQTKGDNTSRDKIRWCEYQGGASTPIADLKRSYGAWMQFTEGQRSPDLAGPFTKQNLTATLRAAGEKLGGVLEHRTPSRPNINQCKFCSAKEPEKMTGACCAPYVQAKLHGQLHTKRGKGPMPQEQACIRGLVLCEEFRGEGHDPATLFNLGARQ